MSATIAIDETDRLISSEKVEGTAVYSMNGERLGTVKNFMVDKRSGRAEYAVLQFGGLFGLGSDYYPLPWEKLRYDTNLAGYVVDIDKARLDNAPRYSTETPTYDEAYNREVQGYWNVSAPFI